MIVQEAKPAFIPKSLSSELRSQTTDSDHTPGLIVSTEDLARQKPNFGRAIAGLLPPNTRPQASALVLSPAETSRLFRNTEELALLKSIAGLIAEQIHPYAKTGVDVVWFVYKAAQLKEAWERPDRDRVACCFKMAGLALDSTKIIGSIYPDLKLPDAWSNGFNFIAKSGDAIWQGKTVAVNEMALSTDKRFEIPIKVLKLAGISLDPPAVMAQSLLGTVTPPTISPLLAKK
jgi:hypothetical protein